MNTSLNVLLLEDCENDAFLLEQEICRGGFAPKVHRIWKKDHLIEALRQDCWDIVVSDYSMPSFNGLEGLALLKQSGRDIPFIIVSGTMGEERAVEAMKAGAHDFLVKGDWARLVPAIERELREARERRQCRQAEQALAAAEGNFRTLVENSIAGIYVIQDERLVYVNPTVCEILGYTADELTSRPLVDFVVPEQRATVEANMRLRMAGTVPSLRYTLRMLRKDGGYTHIEAHGGRTEYNGKLSILGILTDLRPRLEAEERFATIFRASPIGITLSSGVDESIIEANEAFLTLIGHERAEVIGYSFAELGLWSNPEDHVHMLRELSQRGRMVNFEVDLTRKSKEHIQALISVDRVESNGERRTLSFYHDITERKKMEAQFLRNQRLESIGTLAGGIAHDLNNALAPILMSTQLLRMKLEDPEVLQTLDVLESSAQRGADMVKQVLTFARGIEGKHGTVQLKHLIRDTVAMTRQTFPKSIQIREKVARDIWPIVGDATQLHQVLLNLCVNARDAMPRNGTLTLAAENLLLDENSSRIYPEAKAGPYTVLSVIDTGTGMPPHIQERIFEPFFTTKELGKGTGLGLSTVRSIVKNHNGFVTLETAVGKGTQFKVFLPASGSDSSRTTNQEAPSLPSGNGEWILVVDDEAMIRDMARQMLQAFGYHVLTATNGAEAVALCARNIGKIRVVVTDLSMPIMDGAAAIEALRTLDSSVRVVVASGSTIEGLANEPESSIVRAVLEKPYTPEKLLTTINHVLSVDSNLKPATSLPPLDSGHPAHVDSSQSVGAKRDADERRWPRKASCNSRLKEQTRSGQTKSHDKL